MKKTLCSLVCLGALSLNADVLLEVDAFGYKPKMNEIKVNDNAIGGAISVRNYKLNDEDGIAAAFKLGYSGFNSKYKENGIESTEKINAAKVTIDALIGYGFNLSDNNYKHGLNILVGGGLSVFDFGSDSDGYSFPTIKIGVSYFGIYNDFYTNAEAFIKHYFKDFDLTDVKMDNPTVFEADLSAGYKFGGNNNGAYIGAKIGYHQDDIFGKGIHYGITLGYMF